VSADLGLPVGGVEQRGKNEGMEKYIVTLTAEEAEQLQSLVGKGKHAAQKVINALILLNCEQSQGADHRRTSQEIAQVLQVSERKIDRVKRRFVQDGLEVALSGQPSQREYASKVEEGGWGDRPRSQRSVCGEHGAGTGCAPQAP
jgi:hypothetical protein